MKKFLIVLIIIFICGILSADICLEQIKDSEVLIGLDFYKQYSEEKHVFKDVFWSILYERIKLFGFLILLYLTPIRERIGLLLAPLFSFIWGFFLMSCIIELGVAGLVVGLASVIPHGVFYGGVIWLVIRRQKNRYYHSKNSVASILTGFLFGILLFLTGCIIESLIGTHFIPWVIRLSLI